MKFKTTSLNDQGTYICSAAMFDKTEKTQSFALTVVGKFWLITWLDFNNKNRLFFLQIQSSPPLMDRRVPERIYFMNEDRWLSIANLLDDPPREWTGSTYEIKC